MERVSKDKILNAAMKIFAQKGKHGTRMDEIAHAAGINKAMVYYYFSNKDNLYFEVLKTIFSDMFQRSLQTLNKDISDGKNHKDIITNIIHKSFENYKNNPDYTRIMIDALSNAMDEIPKALELIYNTSNLSPTAYILNIIQDGIDKNIFRDVDPRQTMISISGITIIYFLSRNIIRFFDIKIDNEEEFINNRINSVIDLILNGMLKK